MTIMIHTAIAKDSTKDDNSILTAVAEEFTDDDDDKSVHENLVLTRLNLSCKETDIDARRIQPSKHHSSVVWEGMLTKALVYTKYDKKFVKKKDKSYNSEPNKNIQQKMGDLAYKRVGDVKLLHTQKNLVVKFYPIKYEKLGCVLLECLTKPVGSINVQRSQRRTDHSPQQMLRLFAIPTLFTTDQGTD